jgi:hypothetical protein
VVSPSGIITTLAGGGPRDRLGDGLPAPQATLRVPAALAFDSSLNLYVADGGTNRIRQILATRPTMRVAPASLSLAAPSGGAPVTGTISVTGSISGLEFKVSISSAGKWLSADLTADSTPRLLTLTADPGGLASGSYSATVSITPVAATGASSVSISFQVGEAQPPSLRLDQSEISFTLPQAGPPRSSTLLISNGGGQVLSYAATYRVDSGENWLSISPASGSATPGKASTLTVTANPASLSPSDPDREPKPASRVADADGTQLHRRGARRRDSTAIVRRDKCGDRGDELDRHHLHHRGRQLAADLPG